MKAVILKDTGDVSQLSIEEVEIPTIKADEVLVKTKAFSLNPIEIKTRKGNPFSKELLNNKPAILGWDASGIVVQAGTDIRDFKPGDRVFGIIGFPDFGKTYAEYFVAKADDLCTIPENIDFEAAAASNIAALTAYQVLKHAAKIKPGTKILIHAASGGVGHFAVQIAKAMGGVIYATASAEKHTFLKNLGADYLIDYKTEVFEETIHEPLDVVFDLIGGSYIDRSLKVLKPHGLLISIPSVSNADVVEKAEKAGRRGIRFIMKTNKKDLQEVAHLMQNQTFKPFISRQFPFEEIRKAHAALENGHTTGKIIVTV